MQFISNIAFTCDFLPTFTNLIRLSRVGKMRIFDKLIGNRQYEILPRELILMVNRSKILLRNIPQGKLDCLRLWNVQRWYKNNQSFNLCLCRKAHDIDIGVIYKLTFTQSPFYWYIYNYTVFQSFRRGYTGTFVT